MLATISPETFALLSPLAQGLLSWFGIEWFDPKTANLRDPDGHLWEFFYMDPKVAEQQ